MGRFVYIYKDADKRSTYWQVHYLKHLLGTVQEVHQVTSDLLRLKEGTIIEKHIAEFLTPCTVDNTKVGDWVIDKDGSWYIVDHANGDERCQLLHKKNNAMSWVPWECLFHAPLEALPDTIVRSDGSDESMVQAAKEFLTMPAMPDGDKPTNIIVRTPTQEDWERVVRIAGSYGLGWSNKCSCRIDKKYDKGNTESICFFDDGIYSSYCGAGGIDPQEFYEKWEKYPTLEGELSKLSGGNLTPSDIVNQLLTNNKHMNWTNFYDRLPEKLQKLIKAPEKKQLQYGLRNENLELTDEGINIILEAASQTDWGSKALNEEADKRHKQAEKEKKNK